ncbi:hypothetical protein BC834DRAFT_243443 [Gloeopeniophorella convolvens]|nr:hypothetical protein BC834DRAFT_243443 [Gloeopeniophorella convolvens]
MALSVSSFPELPSKPESKTPPRALPSPRSYKRQFFGGLFSRGGAPFFKCMRGKSSPRGRANGPIVEERHDFPTPRRSLSPSPVKPFDNVIDIVTGPGNGKRSLASLEIVIPDPVVELSPQPVEPYFPPTPTASENNTAPSMKDLIKSFRLSRLQRPLDCAPPPQETIIPPWADRGVIASFGNPEQYSSQSRPPANRGSSMTTSSGSSRSSRAAPSSRVSSTYWTNSTAVSSPISTRSRTVPSSANEFEPRSVYTLSEVTTSRSLFSRSRANSETPRSRTSSTSSDKAKSVKGKSKDATPSPAPGGDAAPTRHKRARTLSSGLDKRKGRASSKDPFLRPPQDIHAWPVHRRSSSSTSGKDKSRAKGRTPSASAPPLSPFVISQMRAGSRARAAVDRPDARPKSAPSTPANNEPPRALPERKSARPRDRPSAAGAAPSSAQSASSRSPSPLVMGLNRLLTQWQAPSELAVAEPPPAEPRGPRPLPRKSLLDRPQSAPGGDARQRPPVVVATGMDAWEERGMEEVVERLRGMPRMR